MALIESWQVSRLCDDEAASALSRVLDRLEKDCFDLEITWLFYDRQQTNSKFKNFWCALSLTDLDEARLNSLASFAVSQTRQLCRLRPHSKGTILIVKNMSTSS